MSVDPMRTIDYSPLWTLRRVGSVADVSCELCMLLDAHDVPHHAVRITLNREPLYEVLFARRKDAELACDDARSDLLSAGWRDDVGWMISTAPAVPLAA